MDWIFPRGKDTICKAFNSSVGRAKIPTINDIVIVHYDEQHPKSGRSQKYRLTLLDHITGQPIADELCDSKDGKTILSFLERNLDPNRPIFIITDLDRGYPAIFKEFFGKNLILQFCLLHLNKLIVKDFPRNTTIEQELIKYRLLNIFYNRDRETEFLSELVEEERIMKQKDRKEYLGWLKKEKRSFRKHDLEPGRIMHGALYSRSY
jgi:MULE transposase domain.